MFLRSLVDFDGLTADEIFARLFAWWFGPGFLAAFVLFIAARSGFPVDQPNTVQLVGGLVGGVAAYAGIILTGVVVVRDGLRGGVRRPWLWALIAALVPLVGWWTYGQVRAPDLATRVTEYPGRPSTLARYLNPFWQVRIELLTHLSAEECAARLNAVRVNWMSPGQWFSTKKERPLQGSVSSRGFSVRWRHAMTRPGLLTQASARFGTRGGATLIRLRLGQSVSDRVLVFLWLAIVALVGIPLAIREPAGAPPGFGQFWLAGWVGIFLLVYVIIRIISRDDDLRLRRLIMQTLEAEEIGPQG